MNYKSKMKLNDDEINPNILVKIHTAHAAFVYRTGFYCCCQSVYVGQAGKEGNALKAYIEPAELKKLVDHPVDSIWIIDVRSEKAYLNGHIPTAQSFPAGTIAQRIDEIPRDHYLIIYCTVGGNAQIVSKKLKKAGYKRYINWGGISRWEGERETE